MIRNGIAGCLIAVCLVPVASCTREPEQPPTTTTVTVTPSAEPSTKPAPPPADLTFPPVTSKDAPSTSSIDFVTPSGNIECSGVSGEGAYIQCVPHDVAFVTQGSPPDCELDWLATEINLAGSGASLGGCRGDVPVALSNRSKPVLKYGTVNAYNGIRCLSEVRGLSCWDSRTNHGFFVSKSVFAIF